MSLRFQAQKGQLSYFRELEINYAIIDVDLGEGLNGLRAGRID
jgi:hypothetical protein